LKRLKTNAKLLQKANDELKNINISKSKFYSLLTHDLKSPFQGLLGYANFITQEFYVLTDREKFELISKLNTAIKTQFEFLEQLVIWGKYQSSNNVQVLDACNGKDIINRVLNIYSPLASQKKITINTECNDCEELFIDEDIIKMILRNLVSNAIKFTPVEGKIDLTLKKENDVLTIVVSDTGVGISEDKLVILFNNNSGFTTRGTQEESGHGLGLMMCSEVVQKLDGKILVESTIGSGTTFTVSIPLKDKNPNTAKS
jgi:signal transduction histidine kinase